MPKSTLSRADTTYCRAVRQSDANFNAYCYCYRNCYSYAYGNLNTYSHCYPPTYSNA
jgi:hypothetical protein